MTYKIPINIVVGITMILSILILGDLVITVINIVKFNEKLHQAQIEINNFIRESIDRAEEVKKNIEETIPSANDIKKILHESIPTATEVKKVIEESLEESIAHVDKMKKSIEENMKSNKSNEYLSLIHI